ncbi:glycosyltransferase family 4 protein [Flavobacterium sp.]|uniref:glycosyltransferase family 4 protein n=1 Tax=Flavobacterium sp. TaxID=239 RepID=UPI003BE058B8
MKILFISHKFYPDIGGIEVNSELLANQFIALGAEIKLVTWSKKLGEKKFEYEVIRKPSLRELLKLFRWSDLIYENNPTVRLSWLNVFFKKPRVVAIRTWIRQNNSKIAFVDLFKKKWVNNATQVIAISEAIKRDTSNKAIVIGNPYRSELFKSNTDRNLRVKDFLFLGRLVSDKGADMCVELLNQLKTKYNIECNLSIIGEGPEMESLKNKTIIYKLEKNIHFLGFLKGQDLVNELNKHKYILVPSRWEEPFGNVALEGMACGCIPIASDGGGLPDAVGNAGILFKRNSIEDLTYKTYELLTNSMQQKSLLDNTEAHLANHTEKKVGLRYFDVIVKAYN